MSFENKFNLREDVRWPIVPGNYVVGESNCSVAICTLGTKIDVDLPFAIKGKCMTENIGIEKVIMNIISNSNIRFLILCGIEVPGHHTGDGFKALKKYGVNPDSKRINKAQGPIPIIGNLPLKAIERFRKQIEIVDLIGIIDPKEIHRVVLNCIDKNLGTYQAAPFIVKARKQLVQPHVITYNVSVLPEYKVGLNPFTSIIGIEVMIESK